MTELDPLTIRVIAEDAASRVLQQVQDEIRKTGEAGNNSAKNVDNFASSLKGLAASAGLLIGLREIITFLKESAQEFGSAELASRRLEVALQNNTHATKEQIESLKEYARQLQLVTTYDDDAIISAEARLATLGLTTDEIKRAIPSILDMAAAQEQLSGSSVSLEETASILGKAIENGNLALLGRSMGINVDALQKQLDGVTDSSQRFEIIMNALGKVQGQAAAAAKTLSGQLSQQSVQWGNMKEEIGEKLLPVMIEFGKLILENKDDIVFLADQLITLVQDSKPFVEFLSNVLHDLHELVSVTEDLAKKLPQIPPELQKFIDYTNPFTGFINVYNDFHDTITNKPIVPKIDVAPIVAAKKEIQGIKDVLDSMQSLEREMFGAQSTATVDRLKIVQTMLDQQHIGANGQQSIDLKNLAAQGGFGSEQEAAAFLKANNIRQEGNSQFLQAQVEFAIKQNQLTVDRIDLSAKVQESLKKEEEISSKHTQLLQDQATAADTVNYSTQQQFKLITTEGPKITIQVNNMAVAKEREAKAAERTADALERELEAQIALKALAT